MTFWDTLLGTVCWIGLAVVSDPDCAPRTRWRESGETSSPSWWPMPRLSRMPAPWPGTCCVRSRSLSRLTATNCSSAPASESAGGRRRGRRNRRRERPRLPPSGAKQAGKARLVYFHSSMAATPPERLEMEKRLRFALARKEMLVYYQPQVDVFTGRVTGAEALLRWRPEGLGIVSPAAFVPILEETGQIVDFGRWVLGEACRQGREWIDKTGLRLRIEVNVSASQLALPGFVQDVQQPLLETGFPPELLELELTESAFVGDFAAASRTFRNLRTSTGVNFAVDDFGTGQSSLSYLHQLPFQRLKIDQSFIRGIGDGQEPEPLLETILRMAEGLGMSAIAEGVETPHQLKLLQRLRCPEAQGFLFAPPLPPRDFVEFCGKSSSAGLLSRDGDRPAPLAGPAVPVERRRA